MLLGRRRVTERKRIEPSSDTKVLRPVADGMIAAARVHTEREGDRDESNLEREKGEDETCFPFFIHALSSLLTRPYNPGRLTRGSQPNNTHITAHGPPSNA